MKIKLLISVIIALLFISSFLLSRELIKSKRNYERINQSFAAAEKKITYYKTVNGNLAAKIDVLHLKNSELKNIFPEILAEIKQLKINPRLVNHYSETVIKQEKEVVKQLRDSLIFDTIRVKVFEYCDAFYQLKGIIRDDSIRIKIQSIDTIIQIVYKGKRLYPWRWIFSKRQLQQVIQSKNPNSTIIYSRQIQITK